MRGPVLFGALLAVAVSVGAGSSTPSGNATDYYLKIEGIEGEASDGAIALSGFAWRRSADAGRFEITSPPELAARWQRAGIGHTIIVRDASNRTAGADRRRDITITIVKRADRASPILWETARDGRELPSVEVWQDEGGRRSLVYTLREAVISEYVLKGKKILSNVTGSDADRPVESISFQFGKIEMTPDSPAAATNLNSSRSN